MNANELRALADALEPMAKAPCFDGININRAADYLRLCAEAQPVATLTLLDDMGAQIDFRQSFTLLPGQTFSLYTHPTPTVPDGWKLVPVEPTPEMIEKGAQRLVSWENGCVWPDSWSPLQVAAARNEADRVWRSMWLAAAPKPGDSNE